MPRSSSARSDARRTVDNPHSATRLGIVPRMTAVLDPRETTALASYTEHPLHDGDVVFLIDGRRVLEINGLADHWPQARDGVLHILTAYARRRVLLAVTRHGADLHGSDHALRADLTTSLAVSQIDVLPVQALRS